MMQIDSYLNQEAVRHFDTEKNVYGETRTTSTESFSLRFHEKKKRITNDKGEVFFTDAEIWYRYDQDMQIGNMIEYEEVMYKVVSIDSKRDFSGSLNHKKSLLIKSVDNADTN